MENLKTPEKPKSPESGGGIFEWLVGGLEELARFANIPDYGPLVEGFFA